MYRFLLTACLVLSSEASFVSHRLVAVSRSFDIKAALSFALASSPATNTERDEMVQDLLTVARRVGQVGADASTEEQQEVRTLAERLVPLSDATPARIPLVGVHTLVYSASKGGSSGKIGPFVGKVTQTFADDGIFYNKAHFGPLQVSLRAACEVKSDQACKVTFQETTFSLFGQTVLQKDISGGGVWKYLFVGTVQDADGTRKLIRVMDTPSLFIIEQPL